MVDSTGASRRQPPIADFGFLSDCHSAALVSRDGSIDWWCVPRFDSPSVLGRLLDPEAGFWAIRPVEDFESERHYVGNSLVLRTVVRTAAGEVAVTDALVLDLGSRGHDIGLRSPHMVLRRVEGRSGTVDMCSELVPRLEYGRTVPHLRTVAGGVEARGGPVRLVLTGSVTPHCAEGAVRSSFSVTAGESVEFALRYSPSFGPASQPDAGEPTIEDTLEAWESWAALHISYDGCFPAEVRRSSLILQGLTYRPSGAVVTAATTSLPERLGGALNFDYRFAWLRDLSLTIRSLWIAACPDEPRRLFDWFANSAGQIGDELVQIMYGVEGERDLSEHVLEHLSGYRDSRPVRVGNEAWEQEQLDVLGEVLDASVLLLPIVGFLPATDDRMWSTIEAVERELGDRALVRRWPSDPSGFLICTYWLVECLALGGQTERATQWFHRATGHANDLGLLSEEADPDSGDLLGNFPQAFSHVGLINAAWRIAQASTARTERGAQR